MSEAYYKCVVGRNFIKVWKYERLNVRRRKIRTPSKPMTESDLETAYRYRQRAKKEKLLHLADVNFTSSGSSFVTLTFAEKVTDYEMAVVSFKQFCKRLRRKFEGVRYIATVEIQRRGAIHFHVLLNVPCIEENAEEMKACWTAGIVEVQEVFSVKGCVLYLCKDFETQDREHILFGKRCYFVSQGMEQCQQVNSWNSNTQAKAAIRKLIQGQTPARNKSVQTEHAGQVDYKEYRLDTRCYGLPETAKLKKSTD